MEQTYGTLRTQIHHDRQALGKAAAYQGREILRAAIRDQGRANLILATGNSQLDFLEALSTIGGVDWTKVRVFHMDEYLGIPAEHPASFRRFLKEKIIDAVRPAAFYEISGDAPDPKRECARYISLLEKYPADLCCLGFGENGHLAFNDPPYADFHDAALVKIVALDEVSRYQQVGEGHFPAISEVPTHAITLTIPALLAAGEVLAIVPEVRKAKAVKAALTGPITHACPASVLQNAPHAQLFLDTDSASLLPRPAASERITTENLS